MRLIEVDALKEALDKIPARSIENADGRAYVLIRLSTVFEIIKQMPPAQPETCEGCKHFGKWENEVEYGCPSPCTRCKRMVGDHYERRTE